MDRRLYQASLAGDVNSLLELLKEDELILDRSITACVADTPLHIAAMRGHADFAKEILRRKPEFAHELNSQGLSPLQLACSNGFVDIVRDILTFFPSLSVVRNRDGRSAIHVAAMKGRVEVLDELIRLKPESIRELTNGKETVLHLCVKHDQVDALKMLVRLKGDVEFVNHKDDDGNTILHFATAIKHLPMIEFLLGETRVEVNATSKNGLTALDALALYPVPSESVDYIKLVETLQRKGAKRAWELSTPSNHPPQSLSIAPTQHQPGDSSQVLDQIPEGEMLNHELEVSRMMKQKRDDDTRNLMVVVAVLIVTVTFQAALTPPGGLWQDDYSANSTTTTLPSNRGDHIAGTPILTDKSPIFLALFWLFNKIAFFSSLVVIVMSIAMTAHESSCGYDTLRSSTVRSSSKIVFYTSLIAMEGTYIVGTIPIIRQTSRFAFATEMIGMSFVSLLSIAPNLGVLWKKYVQKDQRVQSSEDNRGEIAILTGQNSKRSN